MPIPERLLKEHFDTSYANSHAVVILECRGLNPLDWFRKDKTRTLLAIDCDTPTLENCVSARPTLSDIVLGLRAEYFNSVRPLGTIYEPDGMDALVSRHPRTKIIRQTLSQATLSAGILGSFLRSSHPSFPSPKLVPLSS